MALRRLENITLADIQTGERIDSADFAKRRSQITTLALRDAVDQLIQVFWIVREGSLLESLIKICCWVCHVWRNNVSATLVLSTFFLDSA